MSRRIVQIAATPAIVDIASDALYALDNNGTAWVMWNVAANATWVRLPQLPSFENRSSPATTAPATATEGVEP